MKKEMAKRWFTVAMLVPAGAFLIFTQIWNGLPLFIGILIFQMLLIFEFSVLVEKKKYRFYLWLTSILVTLSTVNFYLYGLEILNIGYFISVEFALVTVYSIITLFLESISGRHDTAFEVLGFSLFAFLVVGIFFPVLGLLKMMDLSGWLVAIVLSIAWLTDAGGLFIGKWLGKTKLTFLSSPNKTAEGYAGAYLFALITAVILYFIQNYFGLATTISIYQFLVIGLLIATAGIVGDLGESTIKRWARVKDSGALFPGHGGAYDIMDSIVTSAPVLFLILKFMGY